MTWETCTLRQWLNDEFLNAAFTDEEQALLETALVTADRNPDYSTNPGNDTWDKVWLLSITEAERYFGTDTARRCKPTKTAAANGAWTDDNGYCWWWLRSPGNTVYGASRVYSDGSVYYDGYRVYYGNDPVRPLVRLRLD